MMENSIRLVYIGDDSLDLTNGKIYYGIDGWTPSYASSIGIPYLVDECYFLKNDLGLTHLFKKSSFKTLEDFRNEKILNILNDK